MPPNIETKETTGTLFIVQAECLDEKGKTVIRQLGTYQGMCDNGSPGWSSCSRTPFKTIEMARDAAQFPYTYSCYDAHYEGGAIKILEITTHTVTTITTVEHELV
jgi:hypothetical protein